MTNVASVPTEIMIGWHLRQPRRLCPPIGKGPFPALLVEHRNFYGKEKKGRKEKIRVVPPSKRHQEPRIMRGRKK